MSVGLVTWNSAKHLPSCLSALEAQVHQPWEVIVVDNASTDHSVQCVVDCVRRAQIIRNQANGGFARAHNQAIGLARGDYYLALNPDVVMAESYVERLAAALEARPEYGMAGGKLLTTPGLIDGTGLFINRRRQQYLRGHGETDRAQYEQAEEVFGIDGAAPLYRRTMLEDVQLQGQYFDEAFFTYKEDVDLAWRARLLGWRAWYEPAAVATHTRTFRPGRRERAHVATRRYSVCNRYLMLLKNETAAGWRRDWTKILLYDLQILIYLSVREPRSLLALRDLYRLWPDARRKREQVKRRQRVAPEQTLEWFR